VRVEAADPVRLCGKQSGLEAGDGLLEGAVSLVVVRREVVRARSGHVQGRHQHDCAHAAAIGHFAGQWAGSGALCVLPKSVSLLLLTI